jgi:carboxylesterase type B
MHSYTIDQHYCTNGNTLYYQVTQYYPLPKTKEATAAQFSCLITDMLFRCPTKSVSDQIFIYLFNSNIFIYSLI